MRVIPNMAEDALIGRVIAGRYQLLRRLGSGAMATVYEAMHLITSRRSALKRIDPRIAQQQSISARFAREAQLASRIGHPGVVEIYDAGQDWDGAYFLVMELLSGATLAERLAEEPLAWEEALPIVLGFLEPLAAAHAIGIVHRDLKPENVFIQHGGTPDKPRIKLLDFGLARGGDDLSVTDSQAMLGTPDYMAPEQASSAKRVGPPADVWAVGAILYRLFAGRTPFAADSPIVTLTRAMNEPHRPLVDVAPRCSPRLARVIDRCLAKAPEDRYEDAEGLRRALWAALDAPPASFAITERSASSDFEETIPDDPIN
jgi:serine/threonine-protein kinase